MKDIILVFVGGGIGSLLRFGMAMLLLPFTVYFPLATLCSNILSCLLLGIVAGLFHERAVDSSVYLMLVTGLCGGFSTFSSFSYETILLMKEGYYLKSGANIFFNLFLCISFILLGIKISRPF